MKTILFFLFFFLTFVSLAQEKTNYNKDVYPLIKDGKYTEALPLLEQFLNEKPEHVNANYWCAKILESEGKRLSDVSMINKAIKCFSKCSKDVTELDVTMATAGRYPDIKGMETVERLENFKIFLDAKIKECQSLEAKVSRENENKKREAEQAEMQRKKQIEENAKIKEETLEGLTFQELIAILNIQELSIFYEGEATNELTFQGTYNYNIIDGKKTLNGKFNFLSEVEDDSFEGEIINGTGFIIAYYSTFMNENQGIYIADAIKITYDKGIAIKYRVERYANSVYFFETTETTIFKEKFLSGEDFEMKEVAKKSLGNKTIPIAKLYDFPHSEKDEFGSEITVSSYTFIPIIKMKGKYYEATEQIFIDEKAVNEPNRTLLKNKNLVGKNFELNCDAFVYDSEIFTNQETKYTLKSHKEVQIFTPDNYAANYKEVVSAESLNSLNAIAKKWHESMVNGNYEAFKTVCTKYKTPSQEEFKKLHSSYAGFPSSTRYKFQKSSEYLVSAADFFILFNKDFFALKNSGCDMTKTIALIGVYQEKRGDNYERNGDLVFINENGAWKVLYLLSEDINKDDLKTFQALTKEKITPCGCIENIINSDVYNTEKCAFYFRYKKLENESQVFDACFQTLNYCDYQKQMIVLRKELGPNFFGYSNSDKSRECSGQ